MQVVEIPVSHKAVVHGFIQAHPRGPALDAHHEVMSALGPAEMLQAGAHRGQGSGHGIHPPETGRFLYEIRLAGKVITPARRRNLPFALARLLHAAAQSLQRIDAEGVIQFHAEQGLGPWRGGNG